MFPAWLEAAAGAGAPWGAWLIYPQLSTTLQTILKGGPGLTLGPRCLTEAKFN